MADIITVTAPGSANVDIPIGSVLLVTGDGVLRVGGSKHQISAGGQEFGPFGVAVRASIAPATSATYRLFDLWQNAGMARVINDGAANHNVADDEVGAYLRMTATGAKTVTFRPNATHALPTNGEWHIRNAAASDDITLTAGDGVTLNAPAGGTLVMEPGMTVTAKRVAVNVFDVIGLTTAA